MRAQKLRQMLKQADWFCTSKLLQSAGVKPLVRQPLVFVLQAAGTQSSWKCWNLETQA